MKITRRQFAVLGVAAPAGFLSANSRETSGASGQVFERRVYARSGVIPPSSVLRRAGMARFDRHEDERHVEFWIPFDSLGERTRAWDRFNCDPEWCALRARGDVRLEEISFS